MVLGNPILHIRFLHIMNIVKLAYNSNVTNISSIRLWITLISRYISDGDEAKHTPLSGVFSPCALALCFKKTGHRKGFKGLWGHSPGNRKL